MKEEVEKLIDKAEHALKVAEALIKGGYPPDAASKIYYPMFKIKTPIGNYNPD